MTYAILQLNGKQYKVEKGQELVVDRIDVEPGKDLTIDTILLTNKDGAIAVGTPTVAKASAKLTVVEHTRDKKIRVAKFRSKSRYRKVYGHKQPKTVLKVTGLTL